MKYLTTPDKMIPLAKIAEHAKNIIPSGPGDLGESNSRSSTHSAARFEE